MEKRKHKQKFSSCLFLIEYKAAYFKQKRSVNTTYQMCRTQYPTMNKGEIYKIMFEGSVEMGIR